MVIPEGSEGISTRVGGLTSTLFDEGSDSALKVVSQFNQGSVAVTRERRAMHQSKGVYVEFCELANRGRTGRVQRQRARHVIFCLHGWPDDVVGRRCLALTAASRSWNSFSRVIFNAGHDSGLSPVAAHLLLERLTNEPHDVGQLIE